MPDPERHVAFCPHCGNTAPQRIVLRHAYTTDWYGSDGQRLPTEDGNPDCEAIVCTCETCNEILLYNGLAVSETGEWPDLQYPRGSQLHTSVPADVRDVYDEAARVKAQAPRAFAILIRRALEDICDDRGVTEGTLAQRIRKLSERGDIPPVLSEVTDVLRVLGNSAAHGSMQAVTVPTTWAIDDFFRAVVEYVYVAPSKLQEFKEKLAHAQSATKSDA
jgi:hypothetical protein